MIAHALLALMLAAGTDQTLPVKKGMRLEIHSLSGDVDVKVWTRDEVRIESPDAERDAVDIRSGERTLVIRGRRHGGPARSIDLTITVPSWMPVDVEGAAGDVTLSGLEADVSVETVKGDIVIRGGAGVVSARSVQGRVIIEEAKGRIEAQTVNRSIRLAGISGDIVAGTTNGRIELDRIDTSNLDAYTINGGIVYDGAVKDNGTYRLTTHNGSISLTIPERASAALQVRTYGGSFRSTFPVRVENTERRNRFTATIGGGSARIELESFNGEISLRRPGEPPPRDGRERGRNR